MKTISSDKSLVKWQQNINGSNITQVDEYFLKNNYICVFKQLAEFAAVEGPKTTFIDAWYSVCSASCDALVAKLSQYGDSQSVMLVVNKFRGNLGEIMAEKVFELFGTQWDVMPGSYDTVDPQNEMFIDAQGKHMADGLPVGIQVKNYSVHSKNHRNPVKWETFIKSMAMNSYWCADVKIVKPEQYAQFFKFQRQYIFSFTPADFKKLVDDYKGSVRFIGPEEIEKLCLKHKAYVFQQIVDELQG